MLKAGRRLLQSLRLLEHFELLLLFVRRLLCLVGLLGLLGPRLFLPSEQFGRFGLLRPVQSYIHSSFAMQNPISVDLRR